MKIGYARVSTQDQRLDLQMDALERAECDVIFTDKGFSGTFQNRPELERALQRVSPGDELVVWKLDRLGRSVSHMSTLLEDFQSDSVQFRSLTEGIDTTTMCGKLVYHIFSAVGEFERDLIVERTICGMQAAKARGKHLGRPRLLSAEDVHIAFGQYVSGVPLVTVAKLFAVSPSTLKRSFNAFGLTNQGALV